MIFCPPREVDEVWSIVARATAANQLGIAAKVAPRPDPDDPRKDRLICIYTTDFRDKADVERVLLKLRELRLVNPRGNTIYYKPGKLAGSISRLPFLVLLCLLYFWPLTSCKMHLPTSA